MRGEGRARGLLASLFLLAACGGEAPTREPNTGCPATPRTCAETLFVGDFERVDLLITLEADASLTDRELQERFVAELEAMSIVHENVVFGRVQDGLMLTTDRAGFAAICGSARVREVEELTPLCPS